MSLARFTNDNAGGWSGLWMMPLSVFKPTTYNVATGLYELANDKTDWVKVYFQPDGCDIEVEEKRSGFISFKLSAKIPKNRPDLLKDARRLLNVPFVVLAKDNNGQCLLVGGVVDYLIGQIKQLPGGDMSSFNHLELKIERELVMSPLFVKDPFHVAPIAVDPEPVPEPETVVDPDLIVFQTIQSFPANVKTMTVADGEYAMTLNGDLFSGLGLPLLVFTDTENVWSAARIKFSFEIYMDQYVKTDSIAQFYWLAQGVGSTTTSRTTNTGDISPSSAWRTIVQYIDSVDALHNDFYFFLNMTYLGANSAKTIDGAVVKIRNVEFRLVD